MPIRDGMAYIQVVAPSLSIGVRIIRIPQVKAVGATETDTDARI